MCIYSDAIWEYVLDVFEILGIQVFSLKIYCSFDLYIERESYC